MLYAATPESLSSANDITQFDYHPLIFYFLPYQILSYLSPLFSYSCLYI